MTGIAQSGQNDVMPAGSTQVTETAGYTVRAVADRLGIPTATLRSWTRRYDIGPAQERPGKHRLYSEADIAQLGRMVTLIKEGASPAGAAAAVRGPAPLRGDRTGLLAAAFALDSTAVGAIIEAHVRAFGVVDTWDLVCRPTFADIVARQLGGESCIDVEHLLSWCITSVLHRSCPPPASGRIAVVLACTGGETHTLPLEVLRAALAEQGVGAHMLGANVPTSALADTLGRGTGAKAVLLWSQQEPTALSSAVLTCIEAGARVLAGGPGWESVILPEGARRVGSLADAVARLR